jgi:hypothetical protein
MRTRPLILVPLLALAVGCGGSRSSNRATTTAPVGSATAPVTTLATPGAQPAPAPQPSQSPAQPANTPPLAIVGVVPSPASDVVTVAYTLIDSESDAAGIVASWSMDGGSTWRPASRVVGQGDLTSGLATSPAGLGYVFAWDTMQDLGTIERDVVFKVLPSDGAVGVPATRSFTVDNRNVSPTPSPSPAPSPARASLYSLTPDHGARGSTVRVRGTGFSSNPADNLVLINGQQATLLSSTTTELTVIVPTNVPSVTVPVSVRVRGVTALPSLPFRVWDDPALTAVSPNQAAVGDTIRLDGRHFDVVPNGVVVQFSGGVSTFATASSSDLVWAQVPAGAQSGSVWLTTNGARTNSLPFTVGSAPSPAPSPSPAPTNTAPAIAGVAPAAVDPVTGLVTLGYVVADRESDLVTVRVEYRLTSGTFWRPASTHSTAQSLTAVPTSPGGVTRRYVWDSRADVGPGSYRLRFTPSDAAGPGASLESQTITTTAPPAANTPPQILAIATPSGTQSDDVVVGYTVADADGDRVSIRAEFKLGTSGAWVPATAHSSSDPLTGLQAAAGGVTYRFVWDSRADLGAGMGGFTIRLVAHDGLDSSAPAETAMFALSNQAAPSLPTGSSSSPPDVLSVGTPQGTQGAAVEIPYTVADAQSDTVVVEVHYMLSAISGWQPATRHSSSDPTTGVATSPAGLSHRFVWDARQDLGVGLTQAVIVRVRARDGSGTSVGRVTGSFGVDTR